MNSLLFIISIIPVIAFLLFDCVLLALNLKQKVTKVRLWALKKMIMRLNMIGILIAWALLLNRHSLEQSSLYLISYAVTSVIIIEMFYMLYQNHKISYLLSTLSIYVLISGMYLISVIVFFAIIHPLLLIVLLLLSGMIIWRVLIPKTVHKIDKKFNLIPFKHHLGDDLFAGLLKKEDVYMISGPKVNLGINAMLLDAQNTRKMYLSKGLMIHMNSAMIKGIMAHEIGHAYYQHMKQRIILMVPLLVIFIGINVFNFQWLMQYFTVYEFWTIVILLSIMMFKVYKAIIVWLLHKQEFEADDYAKQKGYSTELSQALKAIAKRTDERYIHPLYAKMQRTHPSVKQRIARLNS